MADSVLDRIREQYPQLAWLVNDPEIGQLLRDAVDPNKGFSPTTFQAKLYQTNWFRKQSQSAREWNILKHTDPGEANARRAAYRTEVSRLANSLGIRLSAGQVALTSEAALQWGWDMGGGQLLEAITAHGRKVGNYGAGAIATAASRAKAISQGQYFLPMTTNMANNWGDKIVRGLATEADVTEYMQRQAMSRYKHLSKELAAGNTMEDIFSGHRALIAQELEIAPDTIDFTKGQWAKVIGINDRAAKAVRPMTLYETQTLARQDKRWWGTTNGREADAGMANFMLRMFGKRA